MAATVKNPPMSARERRAEVSVSGLRLRSSGHFYLALLMAEYESLIGDVHARNPRAVEIADAVKNRFTTTQAQDQPPDQ